jgi:hypothetical protein
MEHFFPVRSTGDRVRCRRHPVAEPIVYLKPNNVLTRRAGSGLECAIP